MNMRSMSSLLGLKIKDSTRISRHRLLLKSRVCGVRNSSHADQQAIININSEFNKINIESI